MDVDGNAFRRAIEQGESKGKYISSQSDSYSGNFPGQLRRLTGKGFSGTFQLVDGANKTGGKYEDAIENAIISMNEPKQVSVTGLRDYLSEYRDVEMSILVPPLQAAGTTTTTRTTGRQC